MLTKKNKNNNNNNDHGTTYLGRWMHPNLRPFHALSLIIISVEIIDFTSHRDILVSVDATMTTTHDIRDEEPSEESDVNLGWAIYLFDQIILIIINLKLQS
eukprot:TRINITY_DN39745_c0_g1_i1.p1 TRINITY_DN39745_c0_g1~~TRINITY_DN39745_c0_g1_i1.p1  ORF type:complete len:101 (+),score=4.19 TRINITY_DN39745_c0_g1_i1:1015-1317(+)